MFAKKKIVLNSAVNDNKKGIAEISQLDNLTKLSIKISSFQPNENSNFILLLKNNGMQQRFNVDDPRDFDCDVMTPIDLNQKISCLLIENGQQPIFWGGTETQNNTLNELTNVENENLQNVNYNEKENLFGDKKTFSFNHDNFNSLNHLRNEESDLNIKEKNIQDYKKDLKNNLSGNYNINNNLNSNLNNEIQLNNSYDRVQNDANTAQNVSYPMQNDMHNDNFCHLGLNDYKSHLHLHKIDLADILFDESNLNKDINHAMNQYELITQKDEYNFPQCANCKYKDIFFKEQQLKEVKGELEKIAKMQEEESLREKSLCNQVNIICDNLNSLQHSSLQEDEIVENHINCLDNDDFSGLEKNTIINNNDTKDIENISRKDIEQKDDESKNKEDYIPYYFGLIKNQYDDMFIKYPMFDKLSSIIENSKWIMVDGVDDPYIMGIIYNEKVPQYLCYGVVQEKKQSPPLDIVDSCQWVPFDIENEFGQGAWILYQSAENGETLKVVVE